MSAPIPRIRLNDKRRFSAVYSTAPGTQPYFNVWAGSGTGTLVYSTACASVTSTEWEAYFAPQSAQIFSYFFVASFTNGGVVDPQPPGLFQGLRVTPG